MENSLKYKILNAIELFDNYNGSEQLCGNSVDTAETWSSIEKIINELIEAEREAILEIVRQKKQLNKENYFAFSVCDEVEGCIRARSQ